MPAKNPHYTPSKSSSKNGTKRTHHLNTKSFLDTHKAFNLLFENHPTPMWVYDSKSLRFLAVNASAVRCYGYSRTEFRKITVKDIWLPEDFDCFTEQMKRSAHPKHFASEFQHLTKAGEQIPVEVTANTLDPESPNAYLMMAQDISERKKIEEKLRQLSRAVEQSPASIVITDLRGNIQYVNSRFTRVTGYSPEEVIGQNPRILKSGKTPPKAYEALWRALAEGNEWHGEFTNQKKNGELYHEFAMVSPITDPQGVTTHYLAVKEDITERMRVEKDLKRKNLKLQKQMEKIQALQENLYELAIKDSLTGLYNRHYMNESVEREIARAQRANYPLSFIMIDIDQFKSINDNFGHELGDILIKHLAKQLRGDVRKGDIACRYGGDECLIMLPNTSLDSAIQIAERWRINFQLANLVPAFKTTLSLGVATFPLHGSTSRELLAAADQALYEAKSQGRNRVATWHAQPFS